MLDHTADVGIEGSGTTKAEAFSATAKGMLDLICDTRTIDPAEKVPLELTANDDEQLLVDLLNEILFLGESKGMVFADLSDVEIGPGLVKGTLRGEPIDFDKHSIQHDIKACTYHMLKVWKTNGQWRTRVILDV